MRNVIKKEEGENSKLKRRMKGRTRRRRKM
jgi:hypothetical protein